jgi:hypothetical protein
VLKDMFRLVDQQNWQLLATVHAARARHAISLRDGGLRDIKVSKSPSQTETPVFGDQFSMEKIRFAEFVNSYASENFQWATHTFLGICSISHASL